jgi:hypothetical protein
MARDGVVNVVMRLMNCGFDPRRVGDDAWESRCPAHRSSDHVLSISRGAFEHVVLECRSADHNCTHSRIISALGITNDHVYAETPEAWVGRLGLVPVQSAFFQAAGTGPAAGESIDASGLHCPDGKRPAVGRVRETSSSSLSESALPSQTGATISVNADAPVPSEDGAPSLNTSARPPHPARLTEDGAPSLNTSARPSHPARLTSASSVEPSSPKSNPLPVVERATSQLLCNAEREVEADSSNTNAEAQFAGMRTAIRGFENSLAGSMDLLLSSISIGVDRGDKLERESSVQVLARLAANARMFRSADGRFCAQVPVGDRLEIYGLRSAAFRDWLIDGFLVDQPEPPSNWAIRRVIGMLEARARFSTGIPEVFVRVGQHGDAADPTYFLDLGDPTGRAVAIRDQGWNLVGRPDVHFRRPEGLLPLPEPVHDGSIELLRQYVNLSNADFRLMIGWLTAALRPVGPYPVLVLNGEQASGKSTLARILRMLIDPQTCPSFALPNSTHDLMATAVHGWLLVYENITTIPGWLSDCVCQLAFGGGYASRELFTNGERSIIYAQRPVMLVGIDDFVVRGDLRDRSVFLQLPAIAHTRRRTERSFWPAFQADYPRILGGVLDAIAGGLRELPSVNLKELPRMADYAEWGEAVGRGLGWESEAFLAAYNDNRKAATEAILEDSSVAPMVLALTRVGVNWSGTPQQLYETITKIAGHKLGPRWPTTVGKFGVELRRIAPQLRLHGLSVNFERKRDARIITLQAENRVSASSRTDESSD